MHPQFLLFGVSILLVSLGLTLFNCVASEDEIVLTSDTSSLQVNQTSSSTQIQPVSLSSKTSSTSTSCPYWTSFPEATLISPTSGAVFTTGAQIILQADIFRMGDYTQECPFSGTAHFVVSTSPTFSQTSDWLEDSLITFVSPNSTFSATTEVSQMLTSNTGTYYWFVDSYSSIGEIDQPYMFEIQ